MTVDDELARSLVAARAGDEAAMRALFVEFHPRLLRFLRANEPRVADDLASEVWMAVARGLRAFVGEMPDFRAWLFAIARRRIADHRRAGARRATDPVEASTLEQLADVDDPMSTVVDVLSAKDAAALVLATLPPDQAEVILLRVLGDLSVGEAAAAMDRTPNWVRVTQHRALRRLADRLGAKIDVIR